MPSFLVTQNHNGKKATINKSSTPEFPKHTAACSRAWVAGNDRLVQRTDSSARDYGQVDTYTIHVRQAALIR